jgi:hypothetical protein
MQSISVNAPNLASLSPARAGFLLDALVLIRTALAATQNPQALLSITVEPFAAYQGPSSYRRVSRVLKKYPTDGEDIGKKKLVLKLHRHLTVFHSFHNSRA